MSGARTPKRIAVLAALLTAVAGGLWLRDDLSREVLERQLEALGAWAPLAFIAVYAAGTVAFLPGLIFTIAGGALFGPALGALYSLVGAGIGAVTAFLVARYLARDLVARQSGGRLGRLREGIDREGWRFVAFVRLVPLFPFNLLNYALGLTRIGVVPYTVASLVCMAPGALAYAWVGHAGAEAIAGRRGAIQAALVALGLLAAVVLLPRLLRRVRRGGDPGG